MHSIISSKRLKIWRLALSDSRARESLFRSLSSHMLCVIWAILSLAVLICLFKSWRRAKLPCKTVSWQSHSLLCPYSVDRDVVACAVFPPRGFANFADSVSLPWPSPFDFGRPQFGSVFEHLFLLQSDMRKQKKGSVPNWRRLLPSQRFRP